MAPLSLWAVYAPVPEFEQGKAWSVAAHSGFSHDSNLFGSADSEVSSFVETFGVRLAFNASLDARSFLSAAYSPSVDHYESRPGRRTLDSHQFSLRLARTFSPGSSLDFSDSFERTRNPQSLLNGLPLNTDQSGRRNQLDLRATAAVGPRDSLLLKYRNLNYWFDDGALAQALDRREGLLGLVLSHELRQDTHASLEYRFQDIAYSHQGGYKDKRSHFLLVGGDVRLGTGLQVGARAGFEDRSRSGEPGTTAPSAELTLKYEYARGSFVSGGMSLSLEESSDLDRFTDARMRRYFVNVQHSLTALISLSASLSYEPAEYLGRGLQRNIDESTLRSGTALNWQPTKNWILSLAWDYDRVWSYYHFRELERRRSSLSGDYSF
jgi:hypothetical protein